jgi:general secretion pathway protein L
VPTDAWVQSVSLGREGLEVTGQATTASALISLLEGSPWLERVEFTSPVTKAQSKEQFRLRAGWETPSPLLPPVGRRPGEGG